MAGLGTLEEVRNVWTLDDLLDAHEALDVKQEAEEQQAERARNR